MSDVVMTDAVVSVVSDPQQFGIAFPGWGPYEMWIISILARGDPEEMNRLRLHYLWFYGDGISRALDSAATRAFEMYTILCILHPAERDAHLANRAILNGDYYVLIEIACSRSPEQLLSVRQAYHFLYRRSVEEDVAQHISRKYRKVLVAFITSLRYPGPNVDISLAEAEAAILYEKISGQDYSNNKVIWILATRNKAQVKATLDHYRNAYGNDISKDLKADPNDQFLHILRTIVKCLTRPEKYFEKVLRVAINAENRDEGAIARVLSTRAEVDLNLIIVEYCKKNSAPLPPQLQMLVALVHKW